MDCNKPDIGHPAVKEYNVALTGVLFALMSRFSEQVDPTGLIARAYEEIVE